MGDFNLDANMQFRLDYPHRLIYDCLNNFTTELNFEQLVDFPTWSCTINNIKKESILDHIYSNDTTIISNCSFKTPLFGDHLLIIIDIPMANSAPTTFMCRDWYNYDPSKLVNLLNQSNLINENDSVQEYWNSLENVLINATNDVAHLIEIINRNIVALKCRIIKILLNFIVN